MTMNTTIRVLIFLTAALTYHIPQAAARVSVDIPLDDPVMDRVERLQNRGVVDFGILSLGPLTQGALWKAVSELPDDTMDPDVVAVREYLRRQGWNGSPERSFRTTEAGAGFWATNSKSVPLPEMDAYVNPLLAGRQGEWSEGGTAGWGDLRFGLEWMGWGAIDLIPRLPLAWSHQDSGTSFRPRLYRASVKLGRGDFEVQGGRFPIRWGHGLSGSLILGNEHRPLDGVAVRNAVPTVPPWFFRHLGPTSFSFILARLGDDQHFPNSYMVVQRIALRPWAFLELGYSSAVILGGKGSPSMSTGAAILEVLGRRKGDVYEVNLSNRNFLADIKLRFPELAGFEAYGELFLEDCCGGDWFRDISNIAGIGVTDLLGGRLAINGEWVRTTEITFRNGRFRSGFADGGRLLGHAIGPDAMGGYLFARYRHRGDLWFRAETRFERRGRNQKSQAGYDIRNVFPSFEESEDRWALIVSPTWQIDERLWLRGSLGWEVVWNHAFRRDDTRHHILGLAQAGLSF